MICDYSLRDARTLARIINLAHRFTCDTVELDARREGTATRARFAFTGPPAALTRLRAQIERVIASERVA
ncbi:MAG: hypothetical protein WCE44_09520 [Candidatus Velthaea sp.]|jgi:hypothetical protein